MPAPYYFEDFTEAAYRRLIALAQARYRFVGYPDYASAGPLVIWRHDLDISVERAVAMAEIEAALGATSTWFVLFHSPFYNLLDRDTLRKIQHIQSLGHTIGLHFDASFYDGFSTEAALTSKLHDEKRGLEDLLGTSVDAFSWHNPDAADVLRYQADEMAGMINAYGQTFRTAFTYCSDSNGYWRYDRMRDVLTTSNAPKLHLLTHPVWWHPTEMPPRERVQRCVEAAAAAQLRNYDAMLTLQARENVG